MQGPESGAVMWRAWGQEADTVLLLQEAAAGHRWLDVAKNRSGPLRVTLAGNRFGPLRVTLAGNRFGPDSL